MTAEKRTLATIAAAGAACLRGLLLGTIVVIGPGSPSFAADPLDCSQKQDVTRQIGRMIVAGFFGQTVSDAGFQQVLSGLENGTIGGVLVLGRNIGRRDDFQKIMERLVACNCARKPLIAIDEEGGAVERLGPTIGFDPTPSAFDVAQGSIASAHTVYADVADKLGSLGFNMDLAPVVDLARNPDNPIIARLKRSYGSDVDGVVEYATAFIQELHKKGILAVLKHFPGHGSSQADSHAGLPDVALTWSPDELVPFKRLVDAHLADAVMVGHLANSKRWGGVATQSQSNAISHMLRKDIGFDGVVMTDDLAMKAVSEGRGSTIAAAVDAVRAGADIVLIGRLGDDDQSADVGYEVNRAILSELCAGNLDAAEIGRSLGRLDAIRTRLNQPVKK